MRPVTSATAATVSPLLSPQPLLAGERNVSMVEVPAMTTPAAAPAAAATDQPDDHRPTTLSSEPTAQTAKETARGRRPQQRQAPER